ncbi:transcriptional regulator, MucR family [Desulfacinum hydrothermale DSM 13146]|uniref:Transcriptional regulator, MucR family n=1 Tax=Desulfacinum hydrothermale DSM 13146 TaxID=1121390 RepID=A0A1W1XWM6_9BACT|nr:MucR family transcriptional regulator [Desulfacinum hydrothermale]SMC28272.1 transcriptional regulator, MucR family [Desulfacinum hydrothermale DSM 13146]
MDSEILRMASSIVQNMVATRTQNPMSIEDVEEALQRVCATLAQLESAASAEGIQPVAKKEGPPVEPEKSIQDSHVVCLECGKTFSQLTANHLKTHGLTPREYKKKWGFRVRDSLACRNLQKTRSKAAKKRGLPQKLLEYQEARRQAAKQAGQ